MGDITDGHNVLLHQLMMFFSLRTVHHALEHRDYNHLLVLLLAVATKRRGHTVRTVLVNLLGTNSDAYYRPLHPMLVTHFLAQSPGVAGVMLQSMQYLPLRRLQQQAGGEVEIRPDAKEEWRRWYERSGAQVRAVPEEMKHLLEALRWVPEEEWLLTPPQIVQLGDEVRREGRPVYEVYIAHAKKFRYFAIDPI